MQAIYRAFKSEEMDSMRLTPREVQILKVYGASMLPRFGDGDRQGIASEAPSSASSSTNVQGAGSRVENRSSEDRIIGIGPTHNLFRSKRRINESDLEARASFDTPSLKRRKVSTREPEKGMEKRLQDDGAREARLIEISRLRLELKHLEAEESAKKSALVRLEAQMRHHEASMESTESQKPAAWHSSHMASNAEMPGRMRLGDALNVQQATSSQENQSRALQSIPTGTHSSSLVAHEKTEDARMSDAQEATLVVASLEESAVETDLCLLPWLSDEDRQNLRARYLERCPRPVRRILGGHQASDSRSTWKQVQVAQLSRAMSSLDERLRIVIRNVDGYEEQVDINDGYCFPQWVEWCDNNSIRMDKDVNGRDVYQRAVHMLREHCKWARFVLNAAGQVRRKAFLDVQLKLNHSRTYAEAWYEIRDLIDYLADWSKLVEYGLNKMLAQHQNEHQQVLQAALIIPEAPRTFNQPLSRPFIPDVSVPVGLLPGHCDVTGCTLNEMHYRQWADTMTTWAQELKEDHEIAAGTLDLRLFDPLYVATE